MSRSIPAIGIFYRDRGREGYWRPRRSTNASAQPKVCLFCHRRMPGTRPKGQREFCGTLCRTSYELIDAHMADNPRYAPKGVRMFLLQRAKFLCQYCARPINWSTCNAEHMKPWPKGKTALRNLTISCRPCNRDKLRRRLRPPLLKAVSRGLLVEKYQERTREGG